MLRRVTGVAARMAARGAGGVGRPIGGGALAPSAVGTMPRRWYWKVGGQDPFFAALLDLDAQEIVRLGREAPEDAEEGWVPDGKQLSHAVHALWALAKVDDTQRVALRADNDIRAFMHECFEYGVANNDEDLLTVSIEFLHMAEHDVAAMDELEPLLTKAAAAYPANDTIANWRVPLPQHGRTGA
eukprot:TRINITY_DN1562_c0_g2_i1.p2 TRINITY_DN1562_c0_g2~~TRINITY_DN1562_c0_g2_i1.p2  ORF type:complete len:185 (+),score=54.95 TRINITY_DN1562_c0_g2_i1:57-611(+)